MHTTGRHGRIGHSPANHLVTSRTTVTEYGAKVRLRALAPDPEMEMFVLGEPSSVAVGLLCPLRLTAEARYVRTVQSNGAGFGRSGIGCTLLGLFLGMIL